MRVAWAGNPHAARIRYDDRPAFAWQRLLRDETKGARVQLEKVLPAVAVVPRAVRSDPHRPSGVCDLFRLTEPGERASAGDSARRRVDPHDLGVRDVERPDGTCSGADRHGAFLRS